MPSIVQPLPAELGAAGNSTADLLPFTRVSLTGEPDPLGAYKDQAELAWQALLLRFWQDQTERILTDLGRGRAEGRRKMPAGLLFTKALAVPGSIGTKLGSPSPPVVNTVTPAVKAALPPSWEEKLAYMSAGKIGGLTVAETRKWLKDLQKAAAADGWQAAYTPAEINKMGGAQAKEILLQYCWECGLGGGTVIPESLKQSALGKYYTPPATSPLQKAIAGVTPGQIATWGEDKIKEKAIEVLEAGAKQGKTSNLSPEDIAAMPKDQAAKLLKGTVEHYAYDSKDSWWWDSIAGDEKPEPLAYSLPAPPGGEGPTVTGETLPPAMPGVSAGAGPPKRFTLDHLSKMTIKDKRAVLEQQWGYMPSFVSSMSTADVDSLLHLGVTNDVYQHLYNSGYNHFEIVSEDPDYIEALHQQLQAPGPVTPAGAEGQTAFQVVSKWTGGEVTAKLKQMGYNDKEITALSAEARVSLVASEVHHDLWEQMKGELGYSEESILAQAKQAAQQPGYQAPPKPKAPTAQPAAGAPPSFAAQASYNQLLEWAQGGKRGPLPPATTDHVKQWNRDQQKAMLEALGFSPDQISALSPTDTANLIAKVSGIDPNAPPPVLMPELAGEDKALLAVIGPQLQTDAYTASTVTGAAQEALGVHVDWTLVNTEAATWARKYAGVLVKGIDETTRRLVGDAVGDWISTPGQTYQDLFNRLQEMAYPERRARLIARTEVTRSYAQGSMIAARVGESWRTYPDMMPLFRYYKVWQTKHDHVVCRGCEPMHLEEVEGTQTEYMTPAGPASAPPLHPGCRCWVTFRPEAITREEATEMWIEAKQKAAAKKKETAADKAKKEAEKKKKAAEEAAKKKAEEEAKKKAEEAKKKAEEAKKKAEAEKAKADKEAALKKKVKEQTWKPGDGFVEAEASHSTLAKAPEVEFKDTPWAPPGQRVVLNGIEMTPFDDPGMDFWSDIADNPNITEPKSYQGKLSTGIIMVEPDGRIWVVEPKDHYGGYNYTYPKGSIRGTGLTAQQNALKEVWEESGLLAQIDDILGDYVSEHTQNTTRYYIGHRRAGAPWAFEKESQAVWLVDLARADKFVHSQRDLDVLDALRVKLGLKQAVTAVQEAAPALARTVSLAVGDLPEALAEGLFPDSIDGLQRVRSLGGSTGADLVKDPNTGRLYVMKRGASPDHLRSEVWADTVYRRLGVRVPSCQLYETTGGPVKLAEYIPNTRSLNEVLTASGTAAAKEREKVLAKLREHFVVDAYLGNWDVMGTGWDNILIDQEGDPWRIDNGGAMLYRAQGSQEGKTFDSWMTELWSMRTEPSREWAYRVFGGMDWAEVTRQLEWLGRMPGDALVEGLATNLQDTLKGRLNTVRSLWETSTAFLSDGWVTNYVDEFCHLGIEMKRAGLLSQLPRALTTRGVDVFDETGKKWDALRGPKGVSGWIQKYINENGGDWEVIRQYASSQSGSSQRNTPLAIKHWLAEQMGGHYEDYYWGPEGYNGARDAFQAKTRKFGREVFDKSLRLWHTFNYELVHNVQFDNNNVAEGYVRLMRTEPASVINRYRVQQGQVNRITRGGAESSSIYKTVTVAGDNLTLQLVPHHRVFGTYWTSREVGSYDGAFYGDHENEFIFMAQGLPFYYHGRVGSGQLSSKFWTKSIENALKQATFGGG